MIVINRCSYTLLLSKNPCEIFDYYKVKHMHGLNKCDCNLHLNNNKQAYIAGWSNFIPLSNKRFIFINLARCVNTIDTVTLINHETIHHSLWLHNYDVENKEEEIITWAENETKEIIKIIYKHIRMKNFERIALFFAGIGAWEIIKWIFEL